jgi:hypothetical protein
MLGEVAVNDTHDESFRWWFLPSWMGLDAPCVVTTWTWAVSRATGDSLPARPAIAMFLVVWFIYLSDRLIDVARCTDWTNATGRLRFGRDWRLLFFVCLGFCMLGLVAVVCAGLPAEVIQRGVVVAVGVGLHCLAFVTPIVLGVKLPGKEFGVGLFFALGAYACLGATSSSLPMLVSISVAVAFNCLVIAARDADSDRANDPGGASRWWRTIHRDLLWVGTELTVTSACVSFVAQETAFYLSVATAFAGLTALHRLARRLSGDAVRAIADFALLTPIPIMGAWAW